MTQVIAGVAGAIAWCFAIWLVTPKTKHRWAYRNPFGRTCVTCGRTENQYSDNSWEQMYPLPHAPQCDGEPD